MDAPVRRPQKSGRFLLRIPASLHEEIAWAAALEGSSMNQFICGALTVAVKWRGVSDEARAKQKEELVWKLWSDRFR